MYWHITENELCFDFVFVLRLTGLSSPLALLCLSQCHVGSGAQATYLYRGGHASHDCLFLHFPRVIDSMASKALSHSDNLIVLPAASIRPSPQCWYKQLVLLIFRSVTELLATGCVNSPMGSYRVALGSWAPTRGLVSPRAYSGPVQRVCPFVTAFARISPSSSGPIRA